MTPLELVLSKLPSAKRNGKGYTAPCPAHEDRKPSLSIAEGEGGKVLLTCFAGCTFAEIVAALGLAERDLFPPDPAGRPKGKGGNGKAPAAPIVCAYDYRDSAGAICYQVVRRADKTFPQRRPLDGGHWVWGLNEDDYAQAKDGDWHLPKPWTPADAPRRRFPGTARLLYRLPELMKADPSAVVFIPEGEKDADNVRALGLAATCNSGGAGKYKHVSDDSALYRRPVVIMADKDKAGREHAQDVAARLYGKAASVRIVEMPDGNRPDGGPIKDVSDWIESLDGRTPEDLAAALVGMAEAAPEWTPPAGAQAQPDADTQADPDAGILPVPILANLADVQPQELRWLWPGRIALGKLTMLIGDPDNGKSLITLDLAARVSRGRGFPLCAEAHGEPRGVVLISAEDDLADTIRPRLDAAEADVSRINAFTTVKLRDPETGKVRQKPFTLEDLPALEAAIDRTPDCRLVIIDPISAYMGGTDSHNNSDVRGLLAPLAELAARRGVAILAVSHLRKGEGRAMYRASGSLAFVGAARAVYGVGRDKEDPTGRRRVFVAVKNNLAEATTGLAYTLDASASPNGRPVVVWSAEPVNVTADEALAAEPGHNDADGGAERKEAAEWLRGVLAPGPCRQKEILARAEADGIREGTLRRAKGDLKVVAYRQGFGAAGGWYWRLPDGPGHHAPDGPGKDDPPMASNAPPASESLRTFGENAHLCENTGKTGVSAPVKDAQDSKDAQGLMGRGTVNTFAAEPPSGAEESGRALAERADLDPARPGPLDVLTAEQRKRYQGMYVSRPAAMPPTEKHAIAWRYALGGGQAPAPVEAQA